MQLTRLFTGDDGESHFEDYDIPLSDGGPIGTLSDLIPASGMILRETGADYDYDWHNAPRRQFIIMLSGSGVQIETGDGSRREFGPGDILLVEDTTGRGHRSQVVGNEKRVSVFVTLD